MIFAHGWACDHSFFWPQLDHFSRSQRVVALDHRGYGNSSAAGPYDAATFAADLLWVADELGLDRPVVVGHSMGGAIVAQYAALYPERTAGVVVLDRAIVLDDAWKANIHAATEAIHGPDPRSVVDAMVTAMIGPDDGAWLLEKFLARARSTSVDVLTACMDSFDRWDGDLVASRLAVPTAFVFSTMHGDLAELQRVCPHVVIGETIGAGHFNHLVVPTQVNAMIERFLEVHVTPFLAGRSLSLADTGLPPLPSSR
jgi:pimeloyl-ACP methyl ester carboxylesterase